MSVKAGKMYHPTNRTPVDIYEGFSWPCLFLGIFWYLYKGMGMMALIAFLAAVVTAGISWLIFPFFANKQHINFLRKQGYLERFPVQEETKKCPFCAEEIKEEATVCRYCSREQPKRISAE